MNLRPLKDNIMLKPLYPEDKTRTGIILAKTIESGAMGDTLPDRGVVVNSPSEDFIDGEEVVFVRYGSSIIDSEDGEYYVVPITDIIAKIERN